MKALIIPISALLLIAGLGIFEHFYLNKKFEVFESHLEELYVLATEKTATEEDVAKIEKWWDNEKAKFHIFIPHTIIRDIEFWLAETRGYIVIENFEFALVKIETIKLAARSIPHSFKIDFGNIF